MGAIPNGAAGPTASQQAYGGGGPAAVGAAAFTQGSDVAMGPGQAAAGQAAGGELMAHEATHAVQQGGPAADDKKAKQ